MSSVLSYKRCFLIGIFAGAIATLVFYVGTELLGLPYPPEAIFQLLINPVPGALQSVAVENLREYAKYSALTFASIIFVAIYGVIAMGIGFLSRRKITKWQLIGVGTIITTLLSLGLEAVFASSVSVLSSISGWALVAALAAVINIGFATYVASSI